MGWREGHLGPVTSLRCIGAGGGSSAHGCFSSSPRRVLTAEPFHTPLGQRTAGSRVQVQRLDILSEAARSTLEGRLPRCISRRLAGPRPLMRSALASLDLRSYYVEALVQCGDRFFCIATKRVVHPPGLTQTTLKLFATRWLKLPGGAGRRHSHDLL